eukprot:NODE_567_length_6607_cov_0.300553.p2 type:complete len:320 gc:universal NODE_567_length_6607_cov_0.300553:5733-4774(-)
MPRVLHKYLLPTPVIRMSMHPHNLYELQRHRFALTGKNTFKQRWLAKREILGYFGGTIRTTQFKKIFAKYPIPAPIVNHEQVKADNSIQLSLAFGMMERRLDVILFRALLAPSTFASSSLISRGYVTVNGEVVRAASTLVDLGDIVQLDAKHNQFLYSVPNEVNKLVNLKNSKVDTVYSSSEKIKTKDNSEQVDIYKEMAGALIRGSISNNPLPVAKLKKSSKENKCHYFQPQTFFKPWMFVPNYLEVNYKTNAVVMHRLPNVNYKKAVSSGRHGKYISEIPSPFPAKITSLAYEWFIRRCKRKDLRSRRKALNGLHVS